MKLINIIEFESFNDERGRLVSLESQKNIPFEIRRVYYLFENSGLFPRGMHAHKKLKQIVIALKGSCRFVLDDGSVREELILDDPTKGLLIDSFIWREMHDFSNDCVLCVIASEYFSEDDYIRNYEEFLACRN
ncbi:TDP-4-oxo-6-deoxy-alpha-D-glucose-3, 4-oxoisomerase [Vibrio stylophorae]|uniref:TDP-4-oxo-6-deoxy-alpha-D-glucose-3, 4-oxoisomerase n=1 Tax=Vibrio stylophorae TaxID=659351 RepID=A0ABM8ZWI4_9VIBR|nr:FdtA/QdtA family cupin domain-containing protein [Vibrio stylophorae]CAH0534711.1 TDP-4-oxo-6-deoxy-alpha-D-glucose-3, 4-oxoisomerase [Vibrio stylophorae]